MTTKLRKMESPLRDPFCGKPVVPERARRLFWETRTYFFCSDRCKREFELDPPGEVGF